MPGKGWELKPQTKSRGTEGKKGTEGWGDVKTHIQKSMWTTLLSGRTMGKMERAKKAS